MRGIKMIHSDSSTLIQNVNLISHISTTTALFALLWILSAINFLRRTMTRKEINYHEFVLDIQIFVICFVIMLYSTNSTK